MRRFVTCHKDVKTFQTIIGVLLSETEVAPRMGETVPTAYDPNSCGSGLPTTRTERTNRIMSGHEDRLRLSNGRTCRWSSVGWRDGRTSQG